MITIRNAVDAEMGETVLQRLTQNVENIDAELKICPDNRMLQAAKAETSRLKSNMYQALCNFYSKASTTVL